MPDFYSWVKPLLWQLAPEQAHRVALLALRYGPRWSLPDPGGDYGLETVVWGHAFPNPIGLAAGFDKDAVAISQLFGLGFGFVEVGGVTRHAQSGNPRPRLFRLNEDRAVINRMGLNSAGVEAVKRNLIRHTRVSLPGPLAVNIGINKDSEDPTDDYATVAGAIAPFVDIMTINVSSPNTPGLRALQDPGKLARIVNSVRDTIASIDRPPVVLVKLAPDLTPSDIDDLSTLAIEERFDGLVISNTTTDRPDSLRSRHSEEPGGLSGQPLMDRSTTLLRKIFKQTDGQIPLVGVGGVFSGRDVYAKICAGASLVQLYSALVFEGPALIGRLKSELKACLTKDGFSTVTDAIGTDTKNRTGP